MFVIWKALKPEIHWDFLIVLADNALFIQKSLERYITVSITKAARGKNTWKTIMCA